MFKEVFTFGEYSGLKGIAVSAKTVFSEKSGHGFLREEMIPKEGVGMSSMLGGGFTQRAADCDMQYEDKAVDTAGGVVLDMPRYPLRFKVLVPENGVYRVTLTIACQDKEIHSLFIYTMRRNLVAHNIHIAPNKTYTVSFLVQTCKYKPAASNRIVDEKAVYVSLIGEPAKISALTIEKTDGPTVFVAGDSTLTDQVARYPYYPRENGGGWAQVLLSFLSENIALCNQAHSGLTGTCFREDGHWDLIKDKLKPGDLFLMQFGHNDQKRRSLRPFGGYADNLRWYISEVRARGAFPIIVTPLSRSGRSADGEVNDALIEYAQASIAVGQEMKAPVIDLHEKSLELIKASNPKDTARNYKDGDVTHTNDFGAMTMARLVAEAAEEAHITQLTQYFHEIKPEDFIGLYSAETPNSALIAPPAHPIELPFVDIADSPDLKWIKKAGGMGLLDICVMYLHPAEGLPRAQFLYVFFKALRMGTKHFAQSFYSDVRAAEWESGLTNTSKDEYLIDEATTPDNRFRLDDAITGEEAVSMIVRSMHQKDQRELTIDQCLTEASQLGLLYEGFSSKTFITRGKIFRLLVELMERTQNAEKSMPSSIEVHPIN